MNIIKMFMNNYYYNPAFGCSDMRGYTVGACEELTTVTFGVILYINDSSPDGINPCSRMRGNMV